MFTLQHQDEDIEYEFEKGGYTVEDSKLYISIETKAIDNEAFPDCFKFALDGYPINENIKNSIIKINTNPEDVPPNVYVYTTFHACEVEANITINKTSSNEIEVELEVISEDVNYYNEKAKPNPFIGKVSLQQKSLGELWIPS